MAWIPATLTHVCKRGSSSTPLFARLARQICFLAVGVTLVLVSAATAGAGEADLAIPDLKQGTFHIFGTDISAWNLLAGGALVICGTLGISLYQFFQIKKQPA